jgi:hypothetical protein
VSYLRSDESDGGKRILMVLRESKGLHSAVDTVGDPREPLVTSVVD